MKVVIIDNYDSFTFNLYQYCGEILNKRTLSSQNEIIVKRNDEITVKMGIPILECQNIPTTIEKKINSIPSHELIEKDFNNMGYALEKLMYIFVKF